ncbi:single-stranded-DNA-specific exonuclease RecJ [Candidatus Acetothermia bacterium]|nr:MAG: single-stranded-DNA-specific exonuclease RecJ [Candidatus Acetothermia bacterium]
MRSILREGREWEIALPPDESLIEAIRSSLGCSRPFAVLLAQRGGTSWEGLIVPDRASFHSPFSLPDMEPAVLRLREAIERKEKVFIHGDFDADGLSGAAVLYRGLRPLFPPNSIKVEVGDRLHGHGPSHQFVMRAIEEGFSLVVTADCGIGSHDEIEELARAGIDTIVTDHHLPAPTLPPAVAIIDPHRPDSSYPNRHLAGVGVAYKLIEGLYTRLGRPAPRRLLDLVALGTIADLVPLANGGESENRAMVREGFALIADGEGSSLGIRELLSRFSINPKKLTTSDIGYLVAPKLNAANRAGDPKVAFLLLITEDQDKAAYLAEILLDYNRDREIAQNDLIAQAEVMIRSEGIDPRDSGFVFLVGDYWNEGILGLVASNLTERYRVPSVVLSRGERISRGSCRSIGDFDVNACLEANSALLLQHGGHRMAAGFSIANDAIPKLEERLESYIAAHRSEITALPPERIDTATELAEIDLRLYTELSSLAPYGPGNPRPAFLVRGCRFGGLTLVGNRRQHLKGRIFQGESSLPFIAFRMGRHLSLFENGDEHFLVCRVGFDDWQGSVQVQGIDLVTD